MAEAPLRLVFAGTPDFAARHLQALLQGRHQVAAVYTQPDRPAGRGRALRPGPVKALALRAGLPVHQPASLKSPQAQRDLASIDADVLVVVAYGLILPQAVLDLPTRGCINVHASLLPRWRGAAPIQRAIEAGDRDTGVTIMQMDAGLDTGDLLASARCAVGTHSAASLHDELAGLGAQLLVTVLDDLVRYQAAARPQPETGVTYAHKIDRAEGLLNWPCSARELERRVRAFDPSPGCYAFLDTQRGRVWEAACRPGPAARGRPPGTIVAADDGGILVACGEGCLAITGLQLPGGRRLTAADLLHARSAAFSPGRRFATAPADAPP